MLVARANRLTESRVGPKDRCEERFESPPRWSETTLAATWSSRLPKSLASASPPRLRSSPSNATAAVASTCGHVGIPKFEGVRADGIFETRPHCGCEEAQLHRGIERCDTGRSAIELRLSRAKIVAARVLAVAQIGEVRPRFPDPPRASHRSNDARQPATLGAASRFVLIRASVSASVASLDADIGHPLHDRAFGEAIATPRKR